MCKRVYLLTFFVILVILKVACYEKTLRKMVRNQSKMIQTSFSTGYGMKEGKNQRKNAHDRSKHDNLPFSPMARGSKPLIHKQTKKIRTIISTVDGSRSKTAYSKIEGSKLGNMFPKDNRLLKNTSNMTSPTPSTERAFFMEYKEQNQSHPGELSSETYYEISTSSKNPRSIRYFTSTDADQRLPDPKPTTIEYFTVRPDTDYPKDKISTHVKNYEELSVTCPEPQPSSDYLDNLLSKVIDEANMNDITEDFTREIEHDPKLFSYNFTSRPNEWTQLKEANAEIITQDTFSQLNIEPPSKLSFWGETYERRYHRLMRNEMWPSLKVILVPRTHVDTIWKRGFESSHNHTVRKIITNLVKKLNYYANLTFTWHEVSHLSQWWEGTTDKYRQLFRKFLDENRLEITTGGFVEPDEATTDIFGLVHQLVEGHRWLKHHLNYSPKTAWATNSVSHSATMTYLLSSVGITNLIVTNIHYAWEEYFGEFQTMDFIWLQGWDDEMPLSTELNIALNMITVRDPVPIHSVLTHFLQFNSAGFQACGPDKNICNTDFNFANHKKNLDIYSYNVKERSEMLLEQYSKSGTLTSHNIIVAPLGGRYHYETEAEFDYQYNNYMKIAEFVNMNRHIYKATVEFGTPRDYFKSILKRENDFPTLKGDFVNYADLKSGEPTYWIGYFTSRPLFKILLKRLQATLRTTEILFSFAISFNSLETDQVQSSEIFNLLLKARETTARLLDRHVTSGTLTAKAIKYAHTLILKTVRDCWYIQEACASAMSIKPGQQSHYLQKYVYRDGEFISVFRTVSPGDQIYVFNSLSHERTEIIEVMVRSPNIRVVDHKKNEVTIQINPIWKYTSNNTYKISRRYFKVLFVVMIPPLTFELFKIKETYGPTKSAATIYCIHCAVDELSPVGALFPFNIHPIETGDIQLESYKHRLIFDEVTGFLKSVVEKETFTERTVVINYEAFLSAHDNSGLFCFTVENTNPIHDILENYRDGTKKRILMIISGQVVTELTNTYGRLLQTTVKIYNLLNSPLSAGIHFETKVDYEESPKNRELELFLSIKTDIKNGKHPEIVTDMNGFQYISRKLNMTRSMESNFYPITSMAYLQDPKTRLTYITDHAQGVTAMQEGQLIIVLDRRILFSDRRGVPEGLVDSSATMHRHIIILENFVANDTNYQASSDNFVQYPSLSALYLSNTLNYVLDIFMIDHNHTDLCYYDFLPLVKSPFPCDVSLINYRMINERGAKQGRNAALLILHKHPVTCQRDDTVHPHCSGETEFSIENIFRNLKAVFMTNLVGTDGATSVTECNQTNFRPMELKTFKIHF